MLLPILAVLLGGAALLSSSSSSTGGPAEDPVSTEAVRAAQACLVRLGFPIKVSGQIDGPTFDALRIFQRDFGLAVTGKLDKATAELVCASPTSNLKKWIP